MIESGTFLLPQPKDGKPLYVHIVGFKEDGIDELKNLLKTLDAEITGFTQVVLRKVHPGTYIGGGKVEEIKTNLDPKTQAVIVDEELSPRQLQNLQKALGVETYDRNGVIIEIFSRNARSKESKTQVELARLQYLLPRLAHF